MEPNWNDVNWDFSASNKAAKRLEQMADELEREILSKNKIANDTTINWNGGYKKAFLLRLDELTRESKQIINYLRGLSKQIRIATNNAFAEQKRRENQRVIWYKNNNKNK